jgi:hypothetical protein
MLADLDKEGTKPKRKIACPDILLRACSNFPKVCKLWMLETNESGFQTSRQLDVSFFLSTHTLALALELPLHAEANGVQIRAGLGSHLESQW